MVTVFIVRCKSSPGMAYYTTDFSQVQEEINEALANDYPEDEIYWQEDQWTDEEYHMRTVADEGREFPGW